MKSEENQLIDDEFDMDHDTSHLPNLPDLNETRGHKTLMIIATLVILAVGAFITNYLINNETEAKKIDSKAFVPSVRVVAAEMVDFKPVIRLQGEVEPATQTSLVSEVAGAVVEISPKLEVGEILEKNELIVRVNDADYRTNLTSAKATLADAQLALEQERARSEQAARDWSKLGRGRQASDLVLRKPQIKSAEAMIESAKASVEKAERDLVKTIVRAPYRCIVDKKYLDQGAYLNMLGPIADVYSVSEFEVRLPLSLAEMTLLPENDSMGESVKISTKLSAKEYTWQGKVKRFEGGIDSSTFSVIMVVTVLPNDSNKLFSIPLKGMFVNAELAGDELKNVIRIPLEAIREGDTVWVYAEENGKNTLSLREVDVIRRGKNFIYLKEGTVRDGERVIISPLAIPLPGMDLMLEERVETGENAAKGAQS